MCRRARLIIYDGDEAWISRTKAHDAVKEGQPFGCGNGTIYSIDLNAAELTLFQCQVALLEAEKEESDG